ncbi:hypothetical protein TARUN_4000 [Trichoderma arundinaceum]|uniref:Fucose-specific lectin n=1 Tax=Trichoderma arundinaceum TaxID=490622 RepID=A0A395NQN6_TRIAR|nr:hypothetical protein TARUN_4000 [Trichoderma arundinaceum]
MMPIFDVPYLIQQERQAAATHEVPLSSFTNRPMARSMEEQSNPARDQYYQLHRDPVQRPCGFGVHQLCGSGGDVDSKVDFIDEDAPKGNDNAIRDDYYHIFYGSNQHPTNHVKRDDHVEQCFTPSPRLSPILSSSNLASVFVDGGNNKDSLGILIWQDGAGSLSYMDGESKLKGQRRIEDIVEDAPKAKDGTPTAAVADDTGAAHLFYLDESDILSHVFMKAGGGWKRGGLSAGSKRTVTHTKSKLSAAFHQGEHDTRVVVLSYQDPDGYLQLAMSEDPKTDDDWLTVDFNSFTGRRSMGNWGGIGHAIAGDWQNQKQDPDGSFSGLLMAVEEGQEVTPWECSVDFHASSRKQVECHLLDRAFLDSNGKGISLSSRISQAAWVRTGHGASKAPAQTLPYEFAFLYLDSEGKIQENRVGIDIPRILGSGFNVDMKFDNLATNGNKTVYAKSGSDVVVFRLDADGWQWKVDGIVNTTISETAS